MKFSRCIMLELGEILAVAASAGSGRGFEIAGKRSTRSVCALLAQKPTSDRMQCAGSGRQERSSFQRKKPRLPFGSFVRVAAVNIINGGTSKLEPQKHETMLSIKTVLRPAAFDRVPERLLSSLP